MTDASAPPSESADAAALPPPSGTGSLIWSLLFLGAGTALALLSIDINFLLWGIWLLVGAAAIVRALMWAIAWRRPVMWASLGLRVLAPIVAFSLAGSDLPLRLDEWRTREVRERLAPGLLDSPAGSRYEPGWSFGPVEIIDDERGRYAFFPRAHPILGVAGYVYAPDGDIARCLRHTAILKRRLGERWLWVECED